MIARRPGRAGWSRGARGLWVAGVVGVLGGAPAPGARAAAPEVRGEGRGALAFEMTDCPWPASAVQRIVRLELGLDAEGAAEPGPRSHRRPPPPGADRLSIRCRGTEVVIAATGGQFARSGERSLRLAGEAPAAAERTIALAGVELLASVNPVLRQRLDARAGAGPSGAESSPTPGGTATRAESAPSPRTLANPGSATAHAAPAPAPAPRAPGDAHAAAPAPAPALRARIRHPRSHPDARTRARASGARRRAPERGAGSDARARG